MDNQDQSAFKEMMNTACAAIGKPLFDANSLHLYFAVLESYSVDNARDLAASNRPEPARGPPRSLDQG